MILNALNLGTDPRKCNQHTLCSPIRALCGELIVPDDALQESLMYLATGLKRTDGPHGPVQQHRGRRVHARALSRTFIRALPLHLVVLSRSHLALAKPMSCMNSEDAVSTIRFLSLCLYNLKFPLLSIPDVKDATDDENSRLRQLSHLATILNTGFPSSLLVAVTGHATAEEIIATIVVSSDSSDETRNL